MFPKYATPSGRSGERGENPHPLDRRRSGVNELSDVVKADVLLAVRRFEAFGPDNDPHGEHDFGSFTIDGLLCNWKIDCYDESLRFGSKDPRDPERTTRVLTVMLAEEY